MGRTLVALLRSDTFIACAAVLAYCALSSFAILVLIWLVYQERYGLDFVTFLRVAFGTFR
jgi:hypothetical protein